MKKLINRVLLVNDDGIDAPGMKLLENIASNIANEVWIIAPAIDRSGASNSFSFREPIRIEQRTKNRIAVHGTPSDCVALAINHFMKDSLPDLVLSGINSGSNIGFEIILSGTVGAALTSSVLGVPSIALSQDKLIEDLPNWTVSEACCQQALTQLIQSGLTRSTCLNINFPNMDPQEIKGIKITHHELGKVNTIQAYPTTDPLGDTYFWLRVEHGGELDSTTTDYHAVKSGFISVTPISHERTMSTHAKELASKLGL